MTNTSNVIIISHCRDEIIYFYDYIDKNSLLILVGLPTNQRDREVLNKFIAEAGTRLIQLDEVDTFNTNFELSEKSKEVIKNILSYNNIRVITQAKATVDSDIMSRRVYEYIESLKINMHYVPKYNINNNRIIPLGVQKYLKLYANNNDKLLNSMLSTYNAVDGLKKV
jgi:hypothetical protein